MVIYVIVNSETLRIYVGQHKYDERLAQYLASKFWDANHHTSGSRSHLYNAMRKYPRDCWSIHPLVSGIETKAELDETEKFLIRALKTQNPEVGYNICDGGEGRTGPMSEESKQKISTTMSGRPKTEEHRLHAADAVRGIPKPKSGTFRKQVSKTLTGRKKSAEHAQHIGDGHRGLHYNLGNSWNLGRKASAETRAKMSEAQRKRQARLRGE